MFDFAWSELALIGVVALVAIGPKDMPVAIKAVAGLVKKARRMAGEFQTHVDELLREADLSEVKKEFGSLRNFNLRDSVTRAMDPDGSLRSTVEGNPFTPSTTPPSTALMTPLPAQEIGEHVTPPMIGEYQAETAFFQHSAAPRSTRPDLDAAPAFIPPEAVTAEQARNAAPAFIPPEYADLVAPEPAPPEA